MDTVRKKILYVYQKKRNGASEIHRKVPACRSVPFATVVAIRMFACGGHAWSPYASRRARRPPPAASTTPEPLYISTHGRTLSLRDLGSPQSTTLISALERFVNEKYQSYGCR